MKHKAAMTPNDLEQHFVARANAGDIEGLLALYEPNAVVANGTGQIAAGHEEIRAFLSEFLAARPRLPLSDQAPAIHCGDLALTSSRLENGDFTAEIARRQPDGRWLWVVDQFALGGSE
ncbi:MAG: nuclear transport factor 2 family protein [Xanthomonadales bacterium]|nr:nuclear transport factor 2 family protein [Xanthomonadales bacterium]